MPGYRLPDRYRFPDDVRLEVFEALRGIAAARGHGQTVYTKNVKAGLLMVTLVKLCKKHDIDLNTVVKYYPAMQIGAKWPS